VQAHKLNYVLKSYFTYNGTVMPEAAVLVWCCWINLPQSHCCHFPCSVYCASMH